MSVTDKYNDLFKDFFPDKSFVVNQSIQARDQGASVDLDYVIYTDTDSSFIKLFDVFKEYFNLSSEELIKIFSNFTDDSVKKLSNKVESKQEIIDLLTEIVNQLGNVTDNIILTEFAKKYGIDEKYNHLSFKGEFIFSALLLIARKVYIYSQIAKEGVIDEKIEFLNILKADKSELTNNIIRAVSTLIIKSTSKVEIIKAVMIYIAKYKELIRKKDLQTAQPASLTKPLSEYGTNDETPRGGLIFEYFTDNIGYIRPGTKGKLFLISQLIIKDDQTKQRIQKLGQILKERWKIKNIRSSLNVIFIPEDFETKFDYSLIEINEDAQLVKTLLKPLNQILIPIGINVWDVANIDKKYIK